MRRLDGKVILVAGAGGIGNGLAQRYAAEGAAVVLGDIDADVARETAAGIVAAGGVAQGIALDGGDEGSLKAAIDRAVGDYGGLDGLHANYASFADGVANTDILGLPVDTYDAVMRVNARGYMLATRLAIPAMLARGGGSIVYTSSGAVYIGEPVRMAYAMSKAATHALMRHVANAFGGQGIRCNVIAPGMITHKRFEEQVPVEFAQAGMARTAVKTRLGTPGDIAAVGALLMADEGSYITGQVISVDGGMTMRG